jgi:hypothetical protein
VEVVGVAEVVKVDEDGGEEPKAAGEVIIMNKQQALCNLIGWTSMNRMAYLYLRKS